LAENSRHIIDPHDTVGSEQYMLYMWGPSLEQLTKRERISAYFQRTMNQQTLTKNSV